MITKMSSKQKLGSKKILSKLLNIYRDIACIIIALVIAAATSLASSSNTSPDMPAEDNKSRPSFLDTGDIELPSITVPESDITPKQQNIPAQKTKAPETPAANLPMTPVQTDNNDKSSQETKPSESDKMTIPDKSVPVPDDVHPDMQHKAQETKKDDNQKKPTDVKELPPVNTEQQEPAKQKKKSGVTDIKTHQDKMQQNFVSNEAQILILPNDDIVLGQLQQNIAIENMNFSEYEKLFWKNYYKYIDAPKAAAIDRFIDDYYLYNDSYCIDNDQYDDVALQQAFKAIKAHDFYELSTILGVYEIAYDRDNRSNTLLHMAAKEGNYPAAKLLLMKGVYINAVNDHSMTPAMLAYKYNHPYILYLLRQADGKY